MKKKLQILILLALVGLSASAQGVWTQKANFGGIARNGAFSFSIGNYGYMGGGSLMTDFWRYDPVTNSWTQEANMTDGLTNASTFVINGIGYVALGNGISTNYQLVTYAYNPTNNTWTAKASFPDHGQYSAASFAIGNYGYVGLGNPSGGSSGPFNNNWYRYNPTLDLWDSVATFPGIGRYGTFGIADNISGVGYVGLGGSNATDSVYFNDWWKYNPTNNTWTQMDSIPGIRRCDCIGFCLNGMIYVGTGIIRNQTANHVFYRYNPGNNTWAPIASYPGGGGYCAASFSIGSIGYAGTGYDMANNHNDFWQFSPNDVGIDEVSNTVNISIYPNPANTYLNIHQSTSSTNQLLTITDELGNKVYQQALTNSTTSTIDISNLSNGIYFYEVRSSNESVRGKFVVQH